VLGRSGGLGLVSGRNLIINGDFRINQREYVSGALTAVNEYTLDRWYTRVGTGTFVFTAAPQGQPVTIGISGFERYFAQVIERANFQPGTHVVSWEGTAKAGITSKGYAAASYQSSPFTFESSGLYDTTIEFAGEADTVWNVKVERGSVPTPFATSPIGQELALCLRYYARFSGRGVNFAPLSETGFQTSTTTAKVFIIFPALMRQAPTLSSGGSVEWADAVAPGPAATLSADQTSAQSARLGASFSSTGASYRPGYLRTNDGTGWLAFDAEL